VEKAGQHVAAEAAPAARATHSAQFADGASASTLVHSNDPIFSAQQQQEERQEQEHQERVALVRAQFLKRGMRVLVVEDDDLNVLLMKTTLEVGMREAFGVEAHIQRARTAEEALELVHSLSAKGPGSAESRHPFDVVITDQHMELAGGVMTGTELVEVLRTMPYGLGFAYAQNPILVIASGNASADAIEEASSKRAGADIVWSKPYPSQAAMSNNIASVVQKRAFEPLKHHKT
jgi:CheY-like chemotaxis protein